MAEGGRQKHNILLLGDKCLSKNYFMAWIRVNEIWLSCERRLRRGWLTPIEAFLLSPENGDLALMGCPLLFWEGRKSLELPFWEGEDYFALLPWGWDKVLGPNGFIIAFWQLCWEFVKSCVMGFFGEFYEQGLSATFLTMDKSKKRGWTLMNRCFMCKGEEKSIEHILFHCSNARILWQ